MSRWYPNLTDIHRTPWVPVGTTEKGSAVEFKITPGNDTFTYKLNQAQIALGAQVRDNLDDVNLLTRNSVKRDGVLQAVLLATRHVVADRIRLTEQLQSVNKLSEERALKLSEAISTGNRLRATMDTDQRLLKDISNVVRGRLDGTLGMGLLDVVRQLSLEHKDMRDKLNTGNVTSEEVHDRAAKSSQLQKDLEEVRKVLTDNPFTRTLAAAKVLKEKAAAWETEAGRTATVLQEVRNALGAGSGFSSVIEAARAAASAKMILNDVRIALVVPEGQAITQYANDLRLRAERADRGFDGWVEATEYDKLIEQKRELIDENQSLMDKLAYAQEAIIKKNDEIGVIASRIADTMAASENVLDVATKIHLAANKARVAARKATS